MVATRRHSSGSTLRNDSEDHHEGPKPISLFSSELKGPTTAFFKAAGLGIVLTTICLFAALPIYWGAYYRQAQNLKRLTIGLVDLDTPGAQAAGLNPTLGPALLRGPSLIQEKYHLEYIVVDNTQFDISAATGGAQRGVDVHEWAQKTVHDEDYFGVIIANANATAAASQAFESITGGNANVQYSGSGALSLYINEGRNILTYDQWVTPGMTYFLRTYVLGNAATSLSQLLLPRLNANSQFDPTALSAVLSRPFSYAEWNVGPIANYAGIPASTVGLLYLLIFTYFFSIYFNQARAALEPKLRLKSLIFLRLIAPPVFYVFLSLWISLVSIAFQVPFNLFWGKGGFPLFWLINWTSMWALGLAMECALTLLGPKYTAFFLVFWAILNVSVAFIDIADQAHFYSYGFIMPVFQAVQVSKSIMFGTKQRFIQAFAVDAAWIVFGDIGLIMATVFKRKAAVREKEQKAQKEGNKGE
ncbi:SNG1 family protein [Sporobolomyces salmoneus]|uniref:SNG1 family protein n=1 Tax=Sporobolomyces salmoneus TaxID=183962 RepID=UPI0031752D6D